MRLAGDRFDPYHKWLGISPKDQPPNHYRLLGIELFEPDPDVVDTAATQRMAYLQQCAQGDEAELASRLLNEVAAARLCLLDKSKKARYDDRLRADRRSEPWTAPVQTNTTQSAPTPPAAPVAMGIFSSPPSAPTSYESLPSFDEDIEPLSRRNQSSARKAKKVATVNIIGHVVAPIVGLSVGAIVLFIAKPDLFNFGAKPAPQIAAAPKQDPVKPRQDPIRRSPADVPINPPRRVPRQPEPPKVEIPAPAPDKPEVAPELPPATTEPVTVATLAPLPAAIDLPTLDAAAGSNPLPIGKVEVAGGPKPVLELRSDDSVSLNQSDKPEDQGAWIITAPARDNAEVGRFAVENGDLLFRWVSQVDGAAAHAVQNSILCVKAGDLQSNVRLRKPIEEGPISFEADKNTTFRIIPGHGLDESRDQLSFGPVHLEGFPPIAEVTSSSEDSTAPVKSVTIAVTSGLPRIEVRLALDKGKAVAGMLQLIQAKDEEKGIGITGLRKLIKEIEVPLNKLKKKVETADAQVDGAIKKIQSNKDLAETAKQNLISQLNQKKNNDSDYKACMAEINAKERLLNPLMKLAKVADEMRDAKIHVAVGFKRDDVLVEVCRFGEEQKDEPETSPPAKVETESSGFAPGLRPDRPDADKASDPDQSTLGVRKSLADARRFLEQRRMPAAEKQVIAARSQAITNATKAEVDATDQLRLHVVEFWNGVSQEAASFKGTEELAIGNEKALVVEVKGETLVISLKGKNRSYVIRDMPMPIAVAIAERRLKANDARSQAVFGAGLAVDAQADRNRGRRILQDAASAGSKAAATMLKVIDPQ